FSDLGFPGERAEDWRFTNVAPLLRLPFALAEKTNASITLPPLSTPGVTRLVFVNGIFSAEQSRLPASGFAAGSLAQPQGEHLRQIESLLGQVADPSDHVFTALNAGLVSDGAYVLVPAGASPVDAIEIFYCSTGDERPTASYPRTLVCVGKGGQ